MSNVPMLPTISDYLNHYASEIPDQVWLKDRQGDEFTTWTWLEAQQEANAAAAWLEDRFGNQGTNIGFLSRNRAHWMLADMAVLASGNVSVPLFTTMVADVAKYILEFTEAKALVVGETSNWENIRTIVPQETLIIALPGFDPEVEHIKWEEILQQSSGAKPRHVCDANELMTIPFTSGTTGMPKGVMQHHKSMLVPMQRAATAFKLSPNPRFLSYLPLAHIAERQLVWIQSLIHAGEVTFNEDLTTLLRDMAETRPHYFFGAPRVWEQLHQGILSKLGGQDALDKALADDREGTQQFLQATLGLQDADYLLTAAAPTPPALIEWYESLGIMLNEGYGQSEAMALIVNLPNQRRIGSIGKILDGVEAKITDEGELCVKADGLAPGYYKQPEKTAETFIGDWVHTGDKAKIDEDGFYYITGRVKDYFKTIQGKFVAPPPIEGAFAKCAVVEQLCLLGRGYSKTVMVVVLSELASTMARSEVNEQLMQQVKAVNGEIEKHARIGAVIVANEAWTIENGMLTPTLKLKRDEVDAQFGRLAEALARQSAEQGEILIRWEDELSGVSP